MKQKLFFTGPAFTLANYAKGVVSNMRIQNTENNHKIDVYRIRTIHFHEAGLQFVVVRLPRTCRRRWHRPERGGGAAAAAGEGVPDRQPGPGPRRRSCYRWHMRTWLLRFQQS